MTYPQHQELNEVLAKAKTLHQIIGDAITFMEKYPECFVYDPAYAEEITKRYGKYFIIIGNFLIREIK